MGPGGDTPFRGMKHTYENITFPQLLLRVVRQYILVHRCLAPVKQFYLEKHILDIKLVGEFPTQSQCRVQCVFHFI